MKPLRIDAALDRHAASRPEAIAFRFLEDGEGEGTCRTFAELASRARAIGAHLQEVLRPGDRALLAYPSGHDFIEAFFGCAMAGVVAVPCAVPVRGRRGDGAGAGKLRAIAAHASAGAVLARASDAPDLALALGEPRRPVVATDTIAASDAPSLRPLPAAEVPVLIQYTSGSTAAPRGVVLRHAHLIANAEAIRRAFGVTRARGVSWLPLHHDMGLIGHVIAPVWYGDESVLMSPLSFVHRPARWLRAISRFGARESGGPTFAYETCLRRISEADRAGLDLRSWEIAYCGAEPIRAATLRRFASELGAVGFRSSAFFPCYGLAESTLIVTGGAPGEGMRTAETETRREVTGCGGAVLGAEVKIVDPETLTERPPGVVGEIWTRGPSVADGYWNDAVESARAFGARLAGGSERFLRTGDLGFLRDGRLFVVGRSKDLILARGRKLHPEDLEATAESAHPAVRVGGVAAFATRDEEAAIVCEVGTGDAAKRGEVVECVRAAIAREHEVKLGLVALAPAGSLPRTSSGKISRAACRTRLEEGGLEALPLDVAPPPGAAGRSQP